MIRPMDLGHTHIQMEPDTKVNGAKINRMGRGYRSGQMGSTMRDSTKMEPSQEKACLSFWMAATTRVAFSITKFTEKVTNLVI